MTAIPTRTRQADSRDAEILAAIYTEARKTNILDQACYPSGINLEAQSQREAVFAKDLLDTDSRTFRIVELKSLANEGVRPCEQHDGQWQPIAFIEWRRGTVESMGRQQQDGIANGGQDSSDPKAAATPAESLYGLPDDEALNRLCEECKVGWRETMQDREHIRIEELYTLPTHERRGIASALLDLAKKDADAQNLPMYLESTSLAKPLYERHGFAAQAEYVAHLSLPGRSEKVSYSNWAMLRDSSGDAK